MVDRGKQRIALVVEFDGRAFHGWQAQRNAQAAQPVLEAALARIESSPVQTVACGRLDAGVHAEALVVHADVCAARWRRSPRAYLHGVNAHLPETMRVVALRAVDADFHARFDCLARCYCYRIWRRTTASALDRWRHWWLPRPLDLDAMHAAATLFVGEHDFSAFRAAGCQAHSPHRCVQRIEIVEHGPSLEIFVQANAFLYRMVRRIVGALVEVGLGKLKLEAIQRALKSGVALQSRCAPAHGLSFYDAIYADFSARSLLEEETMR